MDELDRRLLNRIQRSVPLVREPFAQLAAELACDEPTVIERIARLRGERIARLRGDGGVIREISAIFDAVALGYEQALVALAVPADRLDEAGRLAAGHPGASHCYGRKGHVNLWLTLATSPRSALGLAATAELLARRCGASQAMVLPTLRRYKLRVQFDMAAGGASASRPASDVAAGDAPAPGRGRATLTDEQVRAVRALQIDLPCRSDPFRHLAEAESLDADMLLVHAADFLAAGWMRRYAAVLHHRAAGSEANVLVAWAAGEAVADAAGGRCAQVPAVSHCYLRPTAPDWPYNLYTMVHGRTEQDCRLAIEQLAAVSGLNDRAELWTDHEYKKRRIRLFTDEGAAWERGEGSGRE